MNMFGTKYKTSAQVVWTGLSVETVMLSVLHLRMVKIVSKNASVSQVTVIMFSDVDGQNLIVKMVSTDNSVKKVVVTQVMAKNVSCYASVNHNFVTLQMDVSMVLPQDLYQKRRRKIQQRM
uniref:Uncharacterized protein LOC111103505 isoform X1 n=1 Tax=Crassostrea virginica TaxID=6565 RepID=A0A8B8ATY9_CRAVI|nr:uncharacterized protein LOC111103505 isoform X1 [Crassostrea virginica]XP_022294138.1 uncharacterized protein LOC111104459 isoform X1 [Crassostrea virginica]